MSKLPNDAFLDKAFAEASVPALMMSIIHLSGDTSLLDGKLRPAPLEMLQKMDGGLDTEQQAEVHEHLKQALRSSKQSGLKPTFDFSPDTLDKMLAFALGETQMDSRYKGMMLEELAIDRQDSRQVGINPTALANAGLKVAIVGAGMSGLLLALRLQQAGIEYVILEKNAEVGGTWYENSYPGCRVDIASHSYSFSFDHNYRWRHFFGQHEELRAYFANFATEHNLREHIQFNTEVTSLQYQQQDQQWLLNCQHDGGQQVIQANVVISAVGQLNRPKLPDLPGINEFRGTHMHSAQWDHSVKLKGKRVVVVGSGATAFQMVPELAKVAEELSVFQRTPQWMISNPDYHDAVSEEHMWCFNHLPGYARWYRILTLWPMLDKSKLIAEIEPGWNDGGLSCGEWNCRMRENLVSYISSQVDDAELLKKVIPKYPPMGTRVLQDNGSWLRALQQPNVNLISEAVSEVTATGARGADGTEVDADVIVWATGFQTDRFVWPMQVTGREGAQLDELWSKAPKAYLGMTVPSFPNFYCLYGPNTNVAHTGNVILIAECQTRYVMSALKTMCEKGLRSIECKEDVANDYEQRLTDCLSTKVWSHPAVQGFYRLGSTGRVVVNMPWDAVDYWQWTRALDESDYLVS